MQHASPERRKAERPPAVASAILDCLERMATLNLSVLRAELDLLIAHAERVDREDRHAQAVLDSTDRALAAAQSLRQHCRAGRLLQAYQAALMLQASVTGVVMLSWETSAIRGRKVLESAAAGGRTRTQASQLRSEEFCRAADEVRQRHPGLSNRSLYASVARKFGVSPSTIRYHLEKSH